MSASYSLEVLPSELAVCRLDSGSAIPDWVAGEVVSITRTKEELSVVCEALNVPLNVKSECGWRCLRVAGPLDFSMVGVIASLSATLAAAEISVFVVSTFDTDYLLVKEANLALAIDELRAAGHAIR